MMKGEIYSTTEKYIYTSEFLQWDETRYSAIPSWHTEFIAGAVFKTEEEAARWGAETYNSYKVVPIVHHECKTVYHRYKR